MVNEIVETVETERTWKCAICGQVIPSWESHNEEIDKKGIVISAFHEECPEHGK